jgi:hypothetical protein
MSLERRRQRARRLNDDDAPDPVEKGDGGDEVDPDDLSLDYGGVVEKANDEEEKRERREEFAKSVGSSGDGIDFEEVWKGDREEDPEIDYSYEGITDDPAEVERKKDAAAIGEAVADELAARGLAGDDGDAAPNASAEDAGSVEKAGETTADLLDDVQDDLRGMKRARTVRTLFKSYVADGGDPDEDALDRGRDLWRVALRWTTDLPVFTASPELKQGGNGTERATAPDGTPLPPDAPSRWRYIGTARLGEFPRSIRENATVLRRGPGPPSGRPPPSDGKNVA